MKPLLSRLKRVSGTRSYRHHAQYESVLGTSLDLTLVVSDPKQAPRAEAAILAEIDRLAAIFNAYDPLSEFSRWRQGKLTPGTMSSELLNVLQAAENWRQKTDGAFNPAVESATRLWLGAVERGGSPDDEELLRVTEKLARPLWRMDDQGYLTPVESGAPMTLNSIAKGYVIDCACEVAIAGGATTSVINIGGDIRHIGDEAALVQITDPSHPHENAPPLATILLQNQGMATSGGYRRGFGSGANRKSHLIRPETGVPVDAILSATVVAESALLADVLATAFSVMHPALSLAMADEAGSVAVILVESDDKVVSNGLFDAYQVE